MADQVHSTTQTNEAARKKQMLAPGRQRPVALAEQTAPRTANVRRAIASPRLARPADVLALQRVVGNRIVSRFIQTRSIAGCRDAQHQQAKKDRVSVSRMSPLRTSNPVQRDLATPEPTQPVAEQPDLTDAQIREARRYNSQFYDANNTRLIQNILGGPVTGRWTPDNIRAIAATQGQYGLKKDGRVGSETFRFIVREQELEGAPVSESQCLTAFRVVWFPVQQALVPEAGGTFLLNIRGHHKIEAEFPRRCNPSQFQYRQFIAGVATATRGAATEDLAPRFSHIPGGRLPIGFQEDGNTTWASPNYGHRDQAGQATTDARNAENHYVDERGATDQANGSRYRGEDFAGIPLGGLRAGDVVDMLIEFRGEIQRNGRPVQTRQWKDIDTTVTI